MSDAENLNIGSSEAAPGVWELRVTGMVDLSNFGQLEAAIEDIFRKGTRHLLVNLKEARYVSSAGFGCFISAACAAREKGGRIVIIATPPDIKDVFELLGLSQILSFSVSVEAALEFLGKDRPDLPSNPEGKA
jgi:anti-anti-sigma factor